MGEGNSELPSPSMGEGPGMRVSPIGEGSRVRVLSPVPDEPTPAGGGSGAGRAFSVQRYGMLQWGDLFTARQKLALATFCRQAQGGAEDLRSVLGVALSRVAERLSSLARWDNSSKMETVAGTFSRQALPIVWDFAEQNPFEAVGGNWDGAVEWISVVAQTSGALGSGQAHVGDAVESTLPDASSTVWFTDPPYYDAVPYADLSDFFFVWLKRALPDHPLLRDPFDPSNPLTPKTQEAVQDETKRAPSPLAPLPRWERGMSSLSPDERGTYSSLSLDGRGTEGEGESDGDQVAPGDGVRP
jgi:adenine-specific DNA methylase